MENLKGGWPDSLYCPLGKLDVTMDVKKNHMLVGRNVSMTRNSSTCHWSTRRITRDQLQWCVGL